jgi:hypothetical protein
MESPVELVAQLHQLVGQLAACDLGSLQLDELQTLTLHLQREQSRLGVVAAGALVPWESSELWRAGGTLRPELAVGREVRRDRERVRFELRRARLLAQLPYTREAVLAGRLSMDHVDLFVQFATRARLGYFIEHEQLLVQQCAALDLFDDARRAVQYWAARADDELGLRRERPDGSRVYLSRSSTTGEADLSGRLAAIDAEVVEGELRRLMREIWLEDRHAGVVRTSAEMRAAALVRMAGRSVNATGPTARPLFEVIVGDETARRLCELASGVVVAPEQLVPHIDTAVMQAFLFDGANTVVAVSSQRTFTGALRRAIRVRDRRCQHSSVCPAPAADGDIDHRTPAARGGPTSQFNARCLCTTHNRHEHLRDESSPMPERHLTVLDELRCRLRWRYLRDDAEPYTAATTDE